MRQGTKEHRSRARKPIAILASVLMLSAGMVGLASPSGAATSIKKIGVVCGGADAASQGLLDVMGGSISANVDVKADLPDKLEPGQEGATAKFTWTTNLSKSLASTAYGFGIRELTVSNMKMDVAVTGPTTTTQIPGRPPAKSVPVKDAQPITIVSGPFSAELTGIGESGVIKFSSNKLDMTVSLAIAGSVQTLNITCDAPSTLATVAITVAGAPVLGNTPDNPAPELEDRVSTEEGTIEKFDVLGKAKQGVSKSGVPQPIVPESLKIVEGEGTVNADGTIDVPAPAPGLANAVTYELCAPEVESEPAFPGADEVQTVKLDLDRSAEALKRGVAFTFGFEGEKSIPVWTTKNVWGIPLTGWVPAPWENNANTYILGHHFHFPTAAVVRSALESISGIGAGNVEVAPVSGGGYHSKSYDVTFVGALAKSDVPQLSIADFYSIPPQEILGSLIGLAGSLGGSSDGDADATTTTGVTTTIPGGMTVKDYFDKLMFQAGEQIKRGDLVGYGQTVDKIVTLFSENPTEIIDIQAAIAILTSLFPKAPGIATSTPGEEPRDAKIQALCSQGVITVSTEGGAPAPPPDDEPAPAPAPEAGGSGGGDTGGGDTGSGSTNTTVVGNSGGGTTGGSTTTTAAKVSVTG